MLGEVGGVYRKRVKDSCEGGGFQTNASVLSIKRKRGKRGVGIKNEADLD